jgi:hypothetical protein
MLKISAKDGKAGRRLVLEGKLIAPWTEALVETACPDHHADHELVIDLRGVTEISPDGEEALYRLMVQGTKFRGGGLFVRQVLKQLAQRVRQKDGTIRNARKGRST